MSEVQRPQGETYETSDQMMCEVLLMAGFNTISIPSQGNDGQLVYIFSVNEVWPTVEGILTGKADKLTFTYTDWWKAKMTWQMNLRNVQQARRNRN